ncbi:uncharacterized protein LOC125197131 [Salvia hispanica]|uniref:uncharacterized protein LOC125197131 n=1 Tax=Salvia hispanica TaxID=49212 RepID=UPI0020094D75|nr:uncharacterized protein LOC125197131 [Salvia hispanica]
MQVTTALSLSPSFSSYCKVAEIAARTADEFSDERKNCDENEEEFEFSMTARNSKLQSQTSAGDIFHNGEIRPVYSVFNRDFSLGRVAIKNEIGIKNSVRDSVSPKIRLPLRKLFLEERETTIAMSSSSSEDADEIDGVAAVTYCVWPPKAEEEGRCNKSSSAGCNSKRWKLKDFLHRSHSHGSEKDFVELQEIENKSGGKVEVVAPPYNLNGGEKERSYLGLFGDVNALRRNLESF